MSGNLVEKKTVSFRLDIETIKKLDDLAAKKKWSRALLLKEISSAIANNHEKGEEFLNI